MSNVAQSSFVNQDRKCTYNVTLRHVRVTIIEVEKAVTITYSELCVCSLTHLAYNVHAPYCHLWPV